MQRLRIFGLETRDIFLYALAFFVAFWTARAALARGRNPWVWGGAALALGLMPFEQLRLLSVAPVLFLMFFVRPSEQRPAQTQRNTCPKCASVHSPNQNFCTKCGWDLSLEYSPESSDTVLASEMHQPQASSTATMERPADTSAEHPAATPPPSVDVYAEPAPEPVADMERAPDTGPAEQPGAQPSADSGGQDGETATPEPEPEPEDAPRPWGLPQPGPAPTAEVMTARGAVLLSEGKLQEAIDQFTKAIALDPKHREAFERRAEAYTQQGRGERAEEDYRQIQALNTGS